MWQERAQIGLGLVIAAISIGISAADFAGVAGSFSRRIPTITILLLGLLSSYLVFERQSDLRELRRKLAVVHDHARDSLVELRELRSSIRQVDSFFGAAASKEAFDQLKLIYAARELGSVLAPNSITLGREYIFSLWLDCLHNARSFLAFNYVRADEVWRDGWFEEVSLAAQQAAAVGGTVIRRVFVIDSDVEKSILMPLMAKQSEAKLDVRWAYADDITSRPLAADYLDSLGTWDLIALDDNLTMRVFLDETRSMGSCSVTRDADLNAKVKYLFGVAYSLGHPPIEPESAGRQPKPPKKATSGSGKPSNRPTKRPNAKP